MKNSFLKPLTAFFVFLICAISLARVSMPSTWDKSPNEKTVEKKTAKLYRPYQDPKSMRQPYKWYKSSQTTSYPKIKHLENNLTIRVSLKGNRVYILREDQVIYTMLSSSGTFKDGKSMTPTGTYQIQPDRGESFYNPNLNEGAKNWTSWDQKNNYLFHSVPTKENGKYNKKAAQKLGVKPSSHGCIWLSVADSRWLMKHIPADTKVVIKNN